MRYDREHKQQTRQRILTQAAAAIRAHGPDGIGVAALMAKAGLTHGGFYAHFKSKDDLVAQAISHMFEESTQRFFGYASGPDPAIALRSYIDMYLSRHHRDTSEHGCPIAALSSELARMSAAARKRFKAGYEGLAHQIAAHLKELGKYAPQRLATSMIAEMVGAIVLSRAIDDTTSSDRILKASRDAIKARIGI